MKNNQIPRKNCSITSLSKQTLAFVDSIINSRNKTYDYQGISFIVNSKVFPFDRSSKALADYLHFESVDNVLDIGTGSGIQAVIAHLKGAKNVLATDIDSKAVENAKLNIKQLGLEKNIKVLKSDLFVSIPLQKFNIILANLPFSNHNYICEVSHLLFDSGFKLHERFLSQAKKYLSTSGKIILVGGSLGDEKTLFSLIAEYQYKILKMTTVPLEGIKWKIYELEANQDE